MSKEDPIQPFAEASGYVPGDVAWYDNWTEPRRLVTQVVGPFVDVLNESGGKNTVHFLTLQSSEKWASECRRCSDSWNHQHKSLEAHIRENTTPDWSEPRQWAEWRRVHNEVDEWTAITPGEVEREEKMEVRERVERKTDSSRSLKRLVMPFG